MNKWEYKEVAYDGSELIHLLNMHGQEGWELVNIRHLLNFNTDVEYKHLIFKRCLQEQTTDGGSKESSPESNY